MADLRLRHALTHPQVRMMALCAALALTPGADGQAPRAAQETAAPAPWRAVVEHVVVLPAAGGSSPRELSALAWDPVARELAAASDRGRFFRYRLSVEGGRLQAEALQTIRLKPADLNPEALAWRPGPANAPGEWLLAGEQAPTVLRLAPDGSTIGALAWPAGLAAALAKAVEDGASHGVEAIAWHPRHGLLAGLQKPARATATAGGTPTRRHWVHAASGARWGFAVAGPGSQLKAIEVLVDGTLLVLERVQHPGDPRLHAVLRWLDPARCGDAMPCAAPVLPVLPAALVGDDNQEGLACTADNTCWLVNDGGADAAQPTRLTQFRLLPQAAR